MKPTPELSTQIALAGLVERVTFHDAENGFCVRAAEQPSLNQLANKRRTGY